MTSLTTYSKFSGYQVQTLIKACLFFTVTLGITLSPGMPENASNSISILASVSSTLLGFIIAAATILISILDKPFIQNLNKTGHLSKVWHQLVHSGTSMLLALITCLIALSLNKTHLLYACALSFSFLAIAAADLIDCSHKLMKVMARL